MLSISLQDLNKVDVGNPEIDFGLLQSYIDRLKMYLDEKG